MLKTIESLDMLGPEARNGNGEFVRFGVGGSSEEFAKKSEKLKGQNLAKFQKLSKSEKSKGEKLKKLSKSRNLLKFNAMEAGLSFLTLDAREAFNRLRLAFIEASILQYFDSECHIRIKTDVLGYAINSILN